MTNILYNEKRLWLVPLTLTVSLKMFHFKSAEMVRCESSADVTPPCAHVLKIKQSIK